MEFDGKEKKIYHGIWIPFVLILLVPVGIFFLCFGGLSHFTQHYSDDLLLYTCLSIAFFCGFLFGLICLLSGFIHEQFLLLIDRIRDTFDYFKPFSKDAIKWYFYNFKKDGGIIIWIFLLILVGFAVAFAICFTTYLHLYYG